MRLLFFFVFLFFLPLISKGDSPPCWCAFESVSQNNKYVARVDILPEDSLKEKRHARWQISVYAQGVTPKLLWNAQYSYDGYRGGILTDDGQYFISISTWYYLDFPEISLFTIYKSGIEINTSTLTVKTFRIPKRKLIKTISHYTWIDDEYEHQIKQNEVGEALFIFKTHDKKIRKINLDKGILIKDKS
jgi:hypothetical protein